MLILCKMQPQKWPIRLRNAIFFSLPVCRAITIDFECLKSPFKNKRERAHDCRLKQASTVSVCMNWFSYCNEINCNKSSSHWTANMNWFARECGCKMFAALYYCIRCMCIHLCSIYTIFMVCSIRNDWIFLFSNCTGYGNRRNNLYSCSGISDK